MGLVDFDLTMPNCHIITSAKFPLAQASYQTLKTNQVNYNPFHDQMGHPVDESLPCISLQRPLLDGEPDSQPPPPQRRRQGCRRLHLHVRCSRLLECAFQIYDVYLVNHKRNLCLIN